MEIYFFVLLSKLILLRFVLATILLRRIPMFDSDFVREYISLESIYREMFHQMKTLPRQVYTTEKDVVR